MQNHHQGLSAYERASRAREYAAYRNGRGEHSDAQKPRRADLGSYQTNRKTPQKSDGSNKKTQNKKKSMKRTVAVTAGVLLLLIVLSGLGLYRYIFADFAPETTEFDKEQIGIAGTSENKNLMHIAVFGVDSYDEKKGRSDCTMIVTVDKKNRQLKVTSVLRDSYLPIKGHGNDKLTHAFAYGGAPLALHTLNSNFNLDISDYVVLDYKDVAAMIDVVDGLDLEITEKERKEINRIAKEMDENAETVEQDGVVHLNGLQATAYARIRKIDTENMRTQRQRIVLQALIEKCKAQGVLSYPKLMRSFLPYLQTNLTHGKLSRIALSALSCDLTIKEYVVPSEQDNAIGGSYDGFWCWRYDIDAAAERLHTFFDSKIEPEKADEQA